MQQVDISSKSALPAPRIVNTEFVGQVMSSLEIAELVGSRHDNVKRTIETLAESGIVHPHSEDEWSADAIGRPRATRIYRINKRDSFVVVAQLCPEFTAVLVDRWQELESQVSAPTLPSYAEVLRGLADQIEQTERVTVERDHAIATKALIGSKREATAMATASAKSREAAALRDQLGINERHATVISVERATGVKYPKNIYVSLRRWCKAHSVEPSEVADPRYGTVKAWPAAAWLEVHAINLSEVFGGVAV
jgi:phage regulator Rha-like protein